MTPFRYRVALLGAVGTSLGLYAMSLGMPVLEFADHEPVKGHVVLLWGWWGLLTGDYPWLANPLYFIAIIAALIGARKSSQVLSTLALAVGLLSLRVREWWFNEAIATPVENLGAAFYYWMGSFLALTLLLFFVRNQQSQDGDQTAT